MNVCEGAADEEVLFQMKSKRRDEVVMQPEQVAAGGMERGI